MAQQDGVAAARTVPQHVIQPGSQAGLIPDVPGLDCPFQSVAVGEAAGWEGGREPGQKMQKRALPWV